MLSTLSVLAERRDGRVIVHADTVPLAFTLPALRSRDGHDLTAYVRTAVRVLRTPADEQLFAECLLAGRDAVTANDVQRHLTGPLAGEAAAFVNAQDAAAAIEHADALRIRLSRRLEAAGFACGLAPAGPAEVTLDSDTLRDDRRQDAARRRQLDAADHAARLAEKLAAAGPAHRLAASDQAALLPALLASAPAGRVLLAAGANVVVIEADDTIRIVALPDAVGPLRCVRDLGDGRVAVGGANGVALLDQGLAVERLLPAGGASGRGFNAVALLGGNSVVATHGELGLVVWDNAAGPADNDAAKAAPPRVLATPGPARGVLRLDRDRVVLAAGNTVCTCDGQTVTPVFTGGGTATALLPVDDAAIALHCSDGSLTLLDTATLLPFSAAGTGGLLTDTPTSAATGVTGGGLRALLVADARGVRCLTLAGEPLGRLPLPGGCRMLAAAGGRIVGVGPDRATVHVWDAAAPDTPAKSIHILARTGHHITDIAARPVPSPGTPGVG